MVDSNKVKEELIQFRVDKQFGQRLNKAAKRLQTPPGTLSRLWVAQRLEQEFGEDPLNAERWRDNRLHTLAVESGFNQPYAVIHVVPVDAETNILPEAMYGVSRSLKPLFHERYAGNINRQGFRSSSVQEEKEVSYIQLWKSGRAEAAGEIHTEDNRIYGSWLDSHLIAGCFRCCLALTKLHVPLPLRIYISIVGAKGVTFKDQRDSFMGEREIPIVEDKITLLGMEITNAQILEDNSAEQLARVIRPALDELWNASGYLYSLSFDTSGKWLVKPLNFVV